MTDDFTKFIKGNCGHDAYKSEIFTYILYCYKTDHINFLTESLIKAVRILNFEAQYFGQF